MSDSTTTDRPGNGGGYDLARLLPQRSFGLKLMLVCALALLMTIPATLIWTLAYSRSGEAMRAIGEVSMLSGGAQTLMGPAISVPYEREVFTDGKTHTVTSRMMLYPDTGEATLRLDSERRRRGLHDVPVYSADAEFSAVFDPRRIEAEAPAGARILWDEARIFLAMGDLRGARLAELTIGGRSIELSPSDHPGAMEGQWGPSRYIAGPLEWTGDNALQTVEAQARLRISGAERIALAAFARDTTLRLSGDWPSPSFDGGMLPDERSVTSTGFAAVWRVPYLARGAPAVGSNLSFDAIMNMAPGATLLDPGNPYQGVERALKYAPMFIGLVFLTYFLFETTSSIRAHPAQYVLVGLAQCVFYLLLLSVSEIAGFTPGFVVAAAATVLALSLYAGAVFASRAAAVKAMAAFSALYALIYVLMRMEDYALLAGSVASFIAIAGTMWMTRKLDWYGAMRGASATQAPAA